MVCSKILEEQGKPYPRTCAVHGLGPCDNQPPEVYAVYAKNIDRNIFLGYCTSESKEDIEAYYDDKKCYGLMIEQVRPVKIPAGFATKKRN